MRQAIAFIAAIPMVFIGYMAAYLTHEPEGVPLMVAAAILAAIAVVSPFSKLFSIILDYSVYAVVIVVFGLVVYGKFFS